MVARSMELRRSISQVHDLCAEAHVGGCHLRVSHWRTDARLRGFLDPVLRADGTDVTARDLEARLAALTLQRRDE